MTTGVARPRAALALRLVLFVLATAACTPATRTVSTTAGASGTVPGDVASTTPTSASATAAPAPPETTTTTTTTTTAPPPPPRQVHAPGWSPFATTHGVTLVHPAELVERVAFHESNHDGAREYEVAPTAAAPVVLESRERDTPGRTAADIVVAPSTAIRSPVTGTVKRGGGYTLYCKYRDDFVVIAPDAAPHLEVKVLHITGLQVRGGEHVTAGESLLASHATALPFASQVDDLATAQPPWPHVHVEVVDPSIKDRPTPGGGCT
jgi:hypothetical protein